MKKIHGFSNEEIIGKLKAKAMEGLRADQVRGDDTLPLTTADAAEALGVSRRTIFNNKGFLVELMKGQGIFLARLIYGDWDERYQEYDATYHPYMQLSDGRYAVRYPNDRRDWKQ